MEANKYTSAALFDLDHTLFNTNSSFSFGLYLYKRKVIPLWNLLYLAIVYYFCKWGYISLQQMHKRAFETFFKGKKYSDIAPYIAPWLDENWDKMVRPEMMQELQRLQSEKNYTAILSNSPDFIVGPISKRFSMNDFCATRYFLDSCGEFSEIKKWVEGKDKAVYLNQLSAKLGISKEQISAYTDSMLDLPFLKEAGKSICVFPDSDLKKAAMRYNWSVIE